jgi:D-glycero-beta-D-manno-heptose-7-phosphate kinase
LGVVTTVLGVTGNDVHADSLKQALSQAGIDPDDLITDPTRPTTTKSRISGTVSQSVTQQMLRLDRESREPLSGAALHTLLAALEQCVPGQDALLLSDYGLGVFTPEVINACMKLAKRYELPVIVDSQGELNRFAGATLMTPNQPEAEQNLGHALNTALLWEQGITALRKQCGVQHLLITRGQDGMLLEDASGEQTAIPVFNHSEVFDVTGAGDTVVAAMTAAFATGATPVQAAVLGNLAASLTVRHYGCAVTTVPQLQQALQELNPALLEAVNPCTSLGA